MSAYEIKDLRTQLHVGDNYPNWNFAFSHNVLSRLTIGKNVAIFLYSGFRLDARPLNAFEALGSRHSGRIDLLIPVG